MVFGLVIVLILGLITMWDSSAQQRAARYAAPAESAEATEATGAGQAAVPAYPVPPLDLPHYHGVGIDNDTSAREVTGA